MFRIQKQQWRDLGIAMILYAAVIIYQGYQYGQGDQSQILPALYALDHPGAYPNDHYVNAYLESGFNERTIFHALFRYMGYGNSWLVFLWHAIASIGLILGLQSISKTFIRNTGLQWLAVGLILTVGFHTNTGGNEIYYNQFIPSLPAKALVSWALFHWLKGNYQGWSILLIIAGLLQPLVGLQVFLLTTGAMIASKYWRSTSTYIGNIREELPVRLILLYALITLPWIVLLSVYNGGQQNPLLFMNIIETRLSHHFFGSAFGISHLLLGTLFALLCIYFYREKLKWFFILIVTGCLLYEVGVEILNFPIILYSQWWKTTIWIEAFAFIALMAWIEKKFVPRIEKMHALNYFLPVTFVLIIAIYRLTGFFGAKPMYLMPWSKSTTDEIDISQQAGKLTPPGSTFVLPTDMTAFRWYSKRDLYVDYKAMIHNENFLTEWYSRIKEIYGYDLEAHRAGKNIRNISNAVLGNPSSAIVQKWKQAGISHFISTTAEIKTAELTGQNLTYYIYRIP